MTSPEKYPNEWRMTLHAPGAEDPVELPRLIENLRAEFENKLRDLLDATPGGYAEDITVRVSVFPFHGTDTRTLAHDALRDGAKTFRNSISYGTSWGDTNSGTTIFIYRKNGGAK